MVCMQNNSVRLCYSKNGDIQSPVRDMTLCHWPRIGRKIIWSWFVNPMYSLRMLFYINTINKLHTDSLSRWSINVPGAVTIMGVFSSIVVAMGLDETRRCGAYTISPASIGAAVIWKISSCGGKNLCIVTYIVWKVIMFQTCLGNFSSWTRSR